MNSNNNVNYTITLNDLLSAKITLAVNQTERLNNNVKNIQNSLGGLTSFITKAFVINEVIQFGKGVIDTARKLEEVRNQLNFAAGSAVQGAEDFDWVRQKSHELGLESLSTAKSFARMNAAAKDTKYAGQGVKDIFEGASMAATVLHLSVDETEGTLYALQQMMSKSKISAEELNRQLGNRMPGAVKIFASAMGMSAEQFMKMMKDGKALSSEVLPKVAAYMKNEFSSGVSAARESIQVQTILMQNAFTELKASLGEIFTPLIKGVTHVLQGLKGLGEFIKTHKSEVLAMATAVGVFTAAYYVHMGVTKGLIALQTILNSAFLASPIGMITVAIAALAAGIAYCYQEFETFRWAVDSTWEVIKGFGKSMWSIMIMPLKMVYHELKSIVLLLKGDFKGAAQEWEYVGNAIVQPFKDIKEGLLNAEQVYKKGIPKKKEGLKGAIEQTSTAVSEIKGNVEQTDGSKSSKSEASTVGTGKGHNVYININKLIETQNVKVENASRDFVNNIAEEVSKALLLAVNDANRIQTQ